MKKQQRNEGKLARKYDWWWRDAGAFTLLPKGQSRLLPKGQTPAEFRGESLFWKGWGWENAIFAYELVRRAKPELNLPRWHELDPFQQSAVLHAVDWNDRAIIVWWTSELAALKALKDKPADTFSLPLRWNLEVGTSTLLKKFKEIIEEERRCRKIKPRQHRKNSVSWRWLEIWDIHKKEGLPLNNSESGMLSKAVKLSERLSATVLNALKSAKPAL